jgi:hypothetical protein
LTAIEERLIAAGVGRQTVRLLYGSYEWRREKVRRMLDSRQIRGQCRKDFGGTPTLPN